MLARCDDRLATRSARVAGRPRLALTRFSIPVHRASAPPLRLDPARLRVPRLDCCLEILEQTHECDEVVSPTVAARLRACVPAIRPAMSISAAIHTVLAEQARSRPGPRSGGTAPEAAAMGQLDASQAHDR